MCNGVHYLDNHRVCFRKYGLKCINYYENNYNNPIYMSISFEGDRIRSTGEWDHRLNHLSKISVF